MDIEHILRDLGLILGAGLVSQLIATIIRIPQMVVLVAAGALIGPSVLGLVSNPLNGVGAQLLFNIGVPSSCSTAAPASRCRLSPGPP